MSLAAFGPGKVILLGEHAVVYGAQALAGAIARGVHATATPASSCTLVRPTGLKPAVRQQLAAAFEAAAEAAGRPAVQVRVESDLPISMGLGSSGALSVAVARVLLQASAPSGTPSARRVTEVALEMERQFHGTPSGLDHTCSASGAVIAFRKRKGAELGTARTLEVPTPLPLAVVLVGERSPTRSTVAALRERQARWPVRYGRLFDQIGRTAAEGIAAVEQGDLAALGDAMNVNHGLLCGLGLSSAALDAAVHRLRSLGALGAKLTGAGGDGGAVIGLFDSTAKARRATTSIGLPAFTSTLTRSEEHTT